MSVRRKISVRKILQTFITLAAMTFCFIALLSASKLEHAKLPSNVEINIMNAEKYHFLDDSVVMGIVSNGYSTDIVHMPIGKLDVHKMENDLEKNKWVQDAQVYLDNQKVLHLSILQRSPALRIFETNGNSYYLDRTLSTMPLSANYTFYAMVVTNMPTLINDSAGRVLKGEALALTEFIQRSAFWTAQISAITIDTGNIIELVPLMGSQRIILGDTANMKEKFENLYAFYRRVMDRIGWDRYEVLDLRYKNQVVASPALPWKGPIDKAIGNMSWVRSMEDSSMRDKKNNPSIRALGKPQIMPKAKTQAKKRAEKEKQSQRAKQKEKQKSKERADTKKEQKKKEVKKTKGKNASKQNDKEQKKSPKYIYQKKKDN